VSSTTNTNPRNCRREISKVALCVCVVAILETTAFCQNLSDVADKHAVLEFRSDHTIQLSVTGAWPTEQMLNRLRREYGWVVDYEQAPQPASILTTTPDGRTTPMMRSVAVSIPQPVQGSTTEERAILDEFAKNLGNGGGEQYQIVTNGGEQRFDLVPVLNGSMPILSTVITVETASRSVGDSISAILKAASTATGQQIVQGGLADSDLNRVQVTIGGTAQARVLLAQVLDALPFRRIWILTYDPQGQFYAFAVEPAVRAVKNASGQTTVSPVKSVSKKADSVSQTQER